MEAGIVADQRGVKWELFIARRTLLCYRRMLSL
jgi:hypothetical protein